MNVACNIGPRGVRLRAWGAVGAALASAVLGWAFVRYGVGLPLRALVALPVLTAALGLLAARERT